MEVKMDKSKLGNIEAIALIFTVVINHTILSLSKDIVSNTKSAAILNILYLGIIAVIIGFIIYKLLSKFPRARYNRYILLFRRKNIKKHYWYFVLCLFCIYICNTFKPI
jgi:H+/Cl- antiporter ClcA